MGAIGLIFLILFLIGLGMVIYYSFICFQIKPKNSRKYSIRNEIPLLNGGDLNGNLESAPESDLSDDTPPNGTNVDCSTQPSCPSSKDIEIDVPKSSSPPSPPVDFIKLHTTPECTGKNPVKGAVVLDIDGVAPAESGTAINPPSATSQGDIEDGLILSPNPPVSVPFIPESQQKILNYPPPESDSEPKVTSDFPKHTPLPSHTHIPIRRTDPKKVHFVPVACTTALSDPPTVIEIYPENKELPYPDTVKGGFPLPENKENNVSNIPDVHVTLPTAPIDEPDEGESEYKDAAPLGWNREIADGKIGSSQSENRVQELSVHSPIKVCIKMCESSSESASPAEGTTTSDSSSTTSTSDPEITEYSFISGHLNPTASSVLADEISSSLDPPVIGFVDVKPDDSSQQKSNPVTSTPDNSITPILGRAQESEAKDKTSLKTNNDCQTLHSLGTPPYTPPGTLDTADFIIRNPAADESTPATPPPDSSPTFIVIEPYKKRRSISASSSCSSSSGSSTSKSSSEGSFHPNEVLENAIHTNKSRIPVKRKEQN